MINHTYCIAGVLIVANFHASYGERWFQMCEAQ